MSKPSYSTLNLFMRSSLFSLCSWTMTTLYSFVCVTFWVFPLRYRHLLIRTYLRSVLYLLKKICLIDYQVEGLEHIPKDQNGIVFCKHQSTWETFLLPILFHDCAIILKRELLWVPFFGWGLATLDPIVIDRSKKTNAMQQIIQKGKQCLDAGRWIIVFPEGTRMPPGVIGHYRIGGGRLATETGYPVLPIAHNAGHCWPRRKFIKRPGTIKVVIGPLIQSQGHKPEEVLTLAKDWIEGTMVRIDHLFHESACAQSVS